MSEYSIQDLRNKLRLKGSSIRFTKTKYNFYAQGTFDWQCRVGKIKKKSHIYLHYKKGRRGKKNTFEIIKPGENDKKYVIAKIDQTDINYNYNNTTVGCIITYTDIKTKKICEVVLTPCDEKKRTKYDKCPVPGTHFDEPAPHLTNWKRLLHLWILESPSRVIDTSNSKPTRKTSPSPSPSTSTRKSSPSTRKTSPSPSTRETPSRPQSRPQSRTQSRRGGARNYHKATKKRRRKKIKKTRKNK